MKLPAIASNRSIGAWAVFAILASLLICAAVVALYLVQNHGLDRSAAIIRDFRQARVDLYQGYLHATLAGGEDAPWQRAQGVALLHQALAEFRKSIALLPAARETGKAFADELLAFRALLPPYDALALDAQREIELRAAFHRMDSMATRADAGARERLVAIRVEQERIFRLVLAIAVALLAAISTGMIWSARRHATSEAAQAQAMRQAQVGYVRFQKIFDASPVATNIIALEDGRVLAVNEAACRLYGYAREELVGRTADEIGIWTYPAQRDAFLAALRSRQRITDWEMKFRLHSGDIRDGLVSAERIEFLERRSLLVILSDITERKRYEARIEYLATHDDLTNLPNRNLIGDRIAQAAAHARRTDRPFALMFLDLDRFKVLNDGFGHAAGDALLKAVAERLARAVRDGDTVARQYGDEFLVLLPDLHQPVDAHLVAQKLLDALAQPIRLDEGREAHVAASIGVSLFPRDGEDANTLIGNADAAMYRAKALGGNAYQFFARELSDEARSRVELETQLRGALAQNQFHLVYQPKVDLASGRIVGCEALVRWRHPGLGHVSPGRFIPVAEDSGLIVPIGDWVLRTACAQNKAWQDAGHAPVVVSVNLSARQFLQQDVAAWVLGVLAETALAPALLELELTESLIAQDAGKARETVDRLKAEGVKFSIDDFGTGYSSLGQLRRFRVDTLKIDQSFVRDMLVNAEDATIAVAVVSLAHSLGLTVVAEGVETAEQCGFLRQNRCDAIQGYYFSKPVAAADFEAMLRGGKSLPA
jgi:diguanylate cyclase (GGDEF)-like protein/PAS domain S-box-containing protein